MARTERAHSPWGPTARAPSGACWCTAMALPRPAPRPICRRPSMPTRRPPCWSPITWPGCSTRPTAARDEIAGQIVLVPYANPTRARSDRQPPDLGPLRAGRRRQLQPQLARPLRAPLRRLSPRPARQRPGSQRRGDPPGHQRTARRALGNVGAGALAPRPWPAWPPMPTWCSILHCDDDALMHLYLLAAHWPEGARRWRPSLAAGRSFWPTIRAAVPSTNASPPSGPAWRRAFPSGRFRRPAWPVRSSCAARATSRTPSLSRTPGRSIRALQHHGLIAGDPGAPPEALCQATRLEACDIVSGTGVRRAVLRRGDRPVGCARATPSPGSSTRRPKTLSAGRQAIAGAQRRPGAEPQVSQIRRRRASPSPRLSGANRLPWRSEGQLMTRLG